MLFVTILSVSCSPVFGCLALIGVAKKMDLFCSHCYSIVFNLFLFFAGALFRCCCTFILA